MHIIAHQEAVRGGLEGVCIQQDASHIICPMEGRRESTIDAYVNCGDDMWR